MKKVFILLILPVFIGGIFIWDASQRYNYKQICSKDINGDSLIFFPQSKISEIRIMQNIPVWGQLTKQKLNRPKQKDLLQFINNPDNFSEQKHFMLHKQADYIISFYNNDKQETGKIWFCSSCGQLLFSGYAPRSKSGVVKPQKLKKLTGIITTSN